MRLCRDTRPLNIRLHNVQAPARPLRPLVGQSVGQDASTLYRAGLRHIHAILFS